MSSGQFNFGNFHSILMSFTAITRQYSIIQRQQNEDKYGAEDFFFKYKITNLLITEYLILMRSQYNRFRNPILLVNR